MAAVRRAARSTRRRGPAPAPRRRARGASDGAPASSCAWPPGSARRRTLAHELAHALAGVDHGHDDRFRAAHVDVVRLLAGAAPARRASRRATPTLGVPVGAPDVAVTVRVTGDGFVIVP